MVSLQELQPYGTSMKKNELSRLSELREMLESKEKATHVGVKIFLIEMEKEQLFGRNLIDDLIELHKLLSQLKNKVEAGARGSPLQVIRGRVERALQEFSIKLRFGDTLIHDMETALKAFIKDESALLDIVTKVVGKNVTVASDPWHGFFTRPFTGRKSEKTRLHIAQSKERHRLRVIAKKTKEGLRLIMPLYEAINSKYYDFQGRMSGLLLQLKDQVLQGKVSVVDLSKILREVINVELYLKRVIGSVEMDARKAEKAVKFDVHNNRDFVRIVRKMIDEKSRIPYQTGLRSRHAR
jgi:hypothetical protein